MGLFDWLSGLFGDTVESHQRKYNNEQRKSNEQKKVKPRSRPLDNLPVYGTNGTKSNSYQDLSTFQVIGEPSYPQLNLDNWHAQPSKTPDSSPHNHHNHNHESSGSSSWSDSSSSSSSYDSGSSSSSDSGGGSCGGGCD